MQWSVLSPRGVSHPLLRSSRTLRREGFEKARPKLVMVDAPLGSSDQIIGSNDELDQTPLPVGPGGKCQLSHAHLRPHLQRLQFGRADRNRATYPCCGGIKEARPLS